jgi:hypothetical protein
MTEEQQANLSGFEFKATTDLTLRGATERAYDLAEMLASTAALLQFLEKQARGGADISRAFKEKKKIRKFLNDPLFNGLVEEDKRGFLRYEQKPDEDPSELLGPLRDWEANTFPYKTFIDEDPDNSSAIFEIDLTPKLERRGLPDPENTALFMAFTVERPGVFRERQLVFYMDRPAEYKDFEIIDRVATAMPDWQSMGTAHMHGLTEDLASIHDHMFRGLMDVAAEE